MKILFICFVFGAGIVGVLSRRCFVYTEGETKPAIPKGARFGRTCHYVTNGKKRYCMEWDCPPADCSDPIIPVTGCPYCKGTCIRDGRVYKEGTVFKCDCNICKCRMSTRMRCFYTLPKECL